MMKKVIGFLMVALSMMAATAHAALPAGVATTVTAVQTDGQAIFDLVFPVIAAFVGLGVVISLFKRWIRKV